MKRGVEREARHRGGEAFGRIGLDAAAAVELLGENRERGVDAWQPREHALDGGLREGFAHDSLVARRKEHRVHRAEQAGHPG